MGKFIKDYLELCEHNQQFKKEHRTGVFLMNALGVVTCLGLLYGKPIAEKLKEKFQKKEGQV
jgi:hypothetical protein